ncbi:unnamed protein product [Paramecium sonneborni]|uniref:MORN repeat protein n=1 Tax=Paramecium sonneborni TaxID=65129 RepID=A0A8S1PZC3_9CILI|nr:unnamed protein product [Paramecium sonneborni]
MKVGRWDIMYCKMRENQYKQIGGGSYDQEGNQKKIGRWTELDEGFDSQKQLTYKGEYNVNGMKVGRWEIISNQYGEYKQIGGGSYDSEGNQKKIGRWTELDEGFDSQKQLTYKGEYNMNGMKVGKWEIISNQYGEYKQMQILVIFKIYSGGGSYDSEGNQKKIGRWTELDEKFMSMKQITYNGEYNMNGMKVGQWDIMYSSFQ